LRAWASPTCWMTCAGRAGRLSLAMALAARRRPGALPGRPACSLRSGPARRAAAAARLAAHQRDPALALLLAQRGRQPQLGRVP
jgi:hypothetical protein